MEFTRPGMIEWMVTAKIEFESKMKGAQRLAYPPVSAAGPNGLSMHYVHNSDVLRYINKYIIIIINKNNI